MDAEERTSAFVPDQAALIHLYRGEVGRKVLYRVRLDTSTNWAIGMNAGILSLAFTRADPPHLIFAMSLLLTLAFLWIEARRYRTFDMIRERVRLLETGFYAQVLGGKATPGDWAQRLHDSLLNPRPTISYTRAAAVRLRRVYLWLVLLIYVVWTYHLTSGESWTARAQMAGISGVVILTVSAVILVGLVVVAFVPAGIEPEVEAG